MISIVMVMYNAENYVGDAIDSILSQEYTHFELIVVDDGSTDHSIEVVRSYGDERIRIIENLHDYIGSLNLGISLSNGEYIARMDADDIMLPNRLQVQYEYMEDHLDVDVCGSWVEFFGKVSTIYKYPENHPEIVKSMILKNSICHPSTILRRSSLVKKMSLNSLYKGEYIYAEDYKLWIDLIMNDFRFYILPEVLLKYRINDSQVTITKRNNVARTALRVQTEYVHYVASSIIETFPGYYDVFERLIRLLNCKEIDFETFKRVVYRNV